MVGSVSTAAAIEPRGDLAVNARSWGRHLRAANLSARTIQSYLEAVDRLTEYLAANGMPMDVAAIHREHVEAFQEDLLAHWKPTTAANRHAALKVFFGWLVAEGEIKESPMARMPKPRLNEYLPDVLTDAQLKAVLAACEGQAFEDRRDMALIRLFMATGARRAEIASLRWTPDSALTNDVDLDGGIIRILSGKNRRERVVYIGAKAVKALDRYLRLRDKHPHARLSNLWLARKGAFTDSGIAQAVRDRGIAAGLPALHCHQFRHAYAHTMLSNGMQEGDLMAQAGWRSREMLARYAAATRSERSIEAARALKERHPGDRL